MDAISVHCTIFCKLAQLHYTHNTVYNSSVKVTNSKTTTTFQHNSTSTLSMRTHVAELILSSMSVSVRKSPFISS